MPEEQFAVEPFQEHSAQALVDSRMGRVDFQRDGQRRPALRSIPKQFQKRGRSLAIGGEGLKRAQSLDASCQ